MSAILTVLASIMGGAAAVLVSMALARAFLQAYASTRGTGHVAALDRLATMIGPGVAKILGASGLMKWRHHLSVLGKLGVEPLHCAAQSAVIAIGAALLVLIVFSALASLVAGLVLGLLTLPATFVLLERNLATKAELRVLEIDREIPYFLDLSVMMMESGSTFLESIDRYLGDAPAGALADELRALAADIRMGSSLTDALETLATRMPSEPVKNLLRNVRQGVRLGTPIVQTFKDQAGILRFQRSQAAERYAEKTKVDMQLPVMCFMIAAMLLILGPALVKIFTGGVLS